MIRNISNGHTYVGSSSDIQHRWNCHRSDFRLGKHHSRYMQKAWNKYGERNFEFIVLSVCELDSLYAEEQKYIDKMNPVYNVTKKAQGGQVGIKRSSSFRENLSRILLGNKRSLGHRHSDETKAKVSTSLIGNTRSLGHKQSDDTKRKHAQSSKGNTRAAKLAVEQVFQIRMMYDTGKYTQRQLAKVYQVSQPTIQAIVSKRNWREVG